MSHGVSLNSQYLPIPHVCLNKNLKVITAIVSYLWSMARENETLKNKNQKDATYYFIVLLIGSTCFGHYYAHHHELTTIMLITILVDSFLGCCRLEISFGKAGVVSGLQAIARRVVP